MEHSVPSTQPRASRKVTQPAHAQSNDAAALTQTDPFEALAEGASPTSAEVLQLQRTIGNRAVNRLLTRSTAQTGIQRKYPTASAADQHYTQDPLAHPEWPKFSEMMTNAGIDADKIEAAWQLLLGGLQDQERIEQDLTANPPANQQDKDQRRAANSYYQDLVALLKPELRIDTPTLALWSGGLAVSDYAFAKGHTPLERTKAGKVLDNIEMHKNWKLQAPLWNALSRAFVDQAPGAVHIFIRAYDPESVLIRQEIPGLRLLQTVNPQVVLNWHPLYTDDAGKIHEVDLQGNLVNDAVYSTRDQCVAVLYKYLLYIHQKGNAGASKPADRAAEAVEQQLAQNVNPKSGQN